MIIRPFASGDESLWNESDLPSDTRSVPNSVAWKSFIEAEEADARHRLIVLEQDRCIGWLHVSPIADGLITIRRVRSDGDRDAHAVGTALFSFLASSFDRGSFQVLTSDKDVAEPFNAMLRSAGYFVDERRVFMERYLEGFEVTIADRLSFRSLADVGEEFFAIVLAAATTGDPSEDATQHMVEGYQEFIRRAGGGFDPRYWMIAYKEDETIGVILPQVYHDDNTMGSLFYIGVLPEHRRKGYGTLLHAAGLEMLKERGVRRYVGSTHPDNAAMLQVFRRNGCHQAFMQLFYRSPR
jgi:RimJ/RimL family protein N-acetyltransferase